MTTRSRFLACLLMLGVIALPYVFFEGFSGLQLFDDEGTLMITFRDLKHGLRLYDESYALYGPFYYLSIGGLFTGLHVPLVHDSLRLISALFRLACAGLLGALTFRLTRSLVGGLFTSLSLLILYRFMPHSPTHPQELCVLLIAALPHLLLSMETASGRAALLPIAGIGACLAALLLTKINIGLFASLALILTALRAVPASGLARLITGLAIAASLLLPLVLMLPLLQFAWARFYCFATTVAVGATLVAWLGCRHRVWLTPGAVLACLAGMATVAAVTLGVTLARGSSPFGMLNAIVLQNGHFIRNWYIAMPYSAASVAAAVTALAASLFAHAGRSTAGERAIIAACKLAVAVGGVLCLLVMILGIRVDWDTRLALFQFVTPFAFLLLIPTDHDAPIGTGRIGLGLLATFMALYAFPVASDQIAIAESLTVVALPLLFRDGLLSLVPPLARRQFPRGLAIAAGWLSAALCLGGLVLQTRHAWWAWGGGVSADLPGTTLIHVSPAERAERHWVLQRLESCPAFYTLPGLMSFYLWSDRRSPTPLNNNDTLGLLTPAQQARVVADLAREPGLCIVLTPTLLQIFDRGQIATRPPLLRYIDENYATADHYDPYVILTRKVR